MTLTGRQLRDARLRAGIELRELATRADLAPLQLAYAEAEYGAPEWAEEEFTRVRSALQAAGVIFAATDSESPGMGSRQESS